MLEALKQLLNINRVIEQKKKRKRKIILEPVENNSKG